MKFLRAFIFAVLTLSILAVEAVTAQIRKPELIVQTGHSKPINEIALSPDGKLLASASDDGTFKLWDIARGREVRSFSAPLDAFNTVAFSPNGRFLAVGSINKGCKIVNVETGAMIEQYKSENLSGQAVAFSPDGKLLACAGAAGGNSTGDVELWDTSTGKISRLAKSDQVRAIAFSPDGQTLVTGNRDHTVKLWDLKTGAELKIFAGHSEAVETVAFSPDGLLIASGDAGKIALWDARTGGVRSTIDIRKPCRGLEIKSVAFSPNGKFLAAGCNNLIFVWNAATSEKVYQIEDEKIVTDLVFTADGASLLSSGFDTIKMRNAANGKEFQRFKRNANSVGTIAFTGDGKHLANASQIMSDVSNFVRMWSADAGSGMRSLDTKDNTAVAVAFSPNGKILAGSGKDESVILWDAASGQQIRELAFKEEFDLDYMHALTFSPDGKILAGGSKNAVRLWNVSDGSELKSLRGYEETVDQLAFSPDGKVLASVDAVGKAVLWDTGNWRELPTLKNYGETVHAVAFSPDGKFIAVQNGEEINIINIRTGAKARSISTIGEGNYQTLAFSPDGKILAGGDAYDGHIIFWDFQTGKEIKKLVGHTTSVVSIAFGAGGKVLASSSNDGTIRLWNAASGAEMASLVAVGDADWLIVTPDGLFDGSPNAWKELLWRFNNNTFNVAPVEAFFKEFYYPGLLGEILQGAAPRSPEKNLAEVDLRPPGVTFVAVNRQDARTTKTFNASQPTIKIVVGVTENPRQPTDPKFQATGGANDLRLFRNGSLVKLWNKSVFDLTEKDGCRQLPATKETPTRRAVCETEVPIVAGNNNFSAYVFSGDNIKSLNAEMNVRGADSLKRKGTLYVLAVGVNEYANQNFNLRYAVADVESIAEVLKSKQIALGNYAQTEIIELTNKTATKANVLTALSLFGRDGIALPENAPPDLQKIKKLKPEDALVIYYAGHGTASKDSFYLIPHDGFPVEKIADAQTRLEKIYAQSVSDKDLQDALTPVDAGKIVMVIDACNSGQALESDEKRRGPMNSRGLAQLAYEKGMYILTAAQSQQAALEISKLGHGLLTFALLEGFQKAEKDTDGNITERKWLDYATAQVPQLQVVAMQTRSAENQKLPPAQKRSELAVATGDNTKLPPEKRGLQVPRIFYRRELEANPMVVAKP